MQAPNHVKSKSSCRKNCLRHKVLNPTWIHAGPGRTPWCAQQSPSAVSWGTGCCGSPRAACCGRRASRQTCRSAGETRGTACCWGWRGWRRCWHCGTWPQLQEQQRCNGRFHLWALLQVIKTKGVQKTQMNPLAVSFQTNAQPSHGILLLIIPFPPRWIYDTVQIGKYSQPS